MRLWYTGVTWRGSHGASDCRVRVSVVLPGSASGWRFLGNNRPRRANGIIRPAKMGHVPHPDPRGADTELHAPRVWLRLAPVVRHHPCGSLLERARAMSVTNASHTTSTLLLRLINVDRTYQMGEVSVEVLKRVSLDIRAGEFLAIVGPSGSGKTTILNLVGGLDSPTGGQIYFRQQDLSRATAERADDLSPRRDRIRLPVLQSGAQPDRSGERDGGDRTGRPTA